MYTLFLGPPVYNMNTVPESLVTVPVIMNTEINIHITFMKPITDMLRIIIMITNYEV